MDHILWLKKCMRYFHSQKVFCINKRIFFRPSYGKRFPGPSGRPSKPPEIPKRKSYHPIREVTMEVNLLDEIHKLNGIAPKLPTSRVGRTPNSPDKLKPGQG